MTDDIGPPLPDWWEEDYPIDSEVYHLVLTGGGQDTVNYYEGFSLKKPKIKGACYIKTTLEDFLWQADQAGFCVGEGWGMPLDDS